MNGKPWVQQHTDILKSYAGLMSDCAIAKLTGHATITVRIRRRDMGLPAYQWNRTVYSTWDTLTPDQRAAIKKGV